MMRICPFSGNVIKFRRFGQTLVEKKQDHLTDLIPYYYPFTIAIEVGNQNKVIRLGKHID